MYPKLFKIHLNVHPMNSTTHTISAYNLKALFLLVFFPFYCSLFGNENSANIMCPDDLVIGLGVGECGLNVSYDTLSWSSTEELADTIFFPPSETFFSIGTSIVTIAATTVNGDLEVCNFNVVVNEFLPASLGCLNNVQLSLGGQCAREILVSELLDHDSTGCFDSYQVIRLDENGNVQASVIDAFDIGQTFLTIVQHGTTGMQCLNQVTVTGGAPPTITCPPDITVVCNVPLFPSNIGTPDTSGCYQEFDLVYYDETSVTLCSDTIGFQKSRFWVSTDPFGNRDTCEQVITGMRFDIGQVQFPPDFDGTAEMPLLCSNDGSWETVADPAVTGVPVYENFPANTNAECDVTSNYQDMTTQVCGATYDIERVWTVVNICNPAATVKDTQYIKVIDTIPPLFTIPDTIFASLSTDCTDSLVLPMAFNIQECSDFDVEIITPWDTIYTNGGWTKVQLVGGTYPVIYTLTDACGNASSSTNTLLVEDKTITVCPPNTTIDCDYYFDVIAPAIAFEDYDTLALLGMPDFHDNCSFNVTETDSVAVNSCGDGTLFRTLVSDATAPDVCEQIVTVVHVSDFDVIFPKDTSICIPTSTADLGAPILFNFGCENMVTESSDEFITDGPSGCFTMKRTWTLVNDCIYNGTNDNDDTQLADRHFKDGGDGYMEYVQTIIVNSSDAPVFTNGCEIPDLFLFANSCDITVTVPTPEITGCRNIDLSLFGDLGNEIGANVVIGPGTYNIAYSATDECGNTASCLTEFTVSDTIPPVAVCKPQIVVELFVPINSIEPIVEVWANDFADASTDNCGQPLQFSYEKDSLNMMLSFGCCDLGAHPLTLWVSDQYGNQSSCETMLIVQANVVGCDSCDPLLAGQIKTEDSLGIKNATVSIQSTNGFSADLLTDEDGIYLTVTPEGGDYGITPTKNVNPLNGVTTFDAVLMTKHILGVDLLPTPYKIIAADINNSGTVTTFDIVEMRKLILFIYDNFPNNSSWKFVRADYVFPNPEDPWEEIFPTSIQLNNLSVSMLDLDFIGIKIGDLNNSANPLN